jgi:hypothetical protein
MHKLPLMATCRPTFILNLTSFYTEPMCCVSVSSMFTNILIFPLSFVMLQTIFCRSVPLSAVAAISPVKRRLQIVWPLRTAQFVQGYSHNNLYEILNNRGNSRHPSSTPTIVSNHSVKSEPALNALNVAS